MVPGVTETSGTSPGREGPRLEVSIVEGRQEDKTGHGALLSGSCVALGLAVLHHTQSNLCSTLTHVKPEYYKKQLAAL